MKEKITVALEWCLANPNLSFWVIAFSVSFLILLLAYLLLSNARLHVHINGLNKDKARLMQEKDLIRLGKENQSKSESLN